MLNDFASKVHGTYYIHKFPNKKELKKLPKEDIIELVRLLKNDCVANFEVRMQQNHFMTNLALELTRRLKAGIDFVEETEQEEKEKGIQNPLTGVFYGISKTAADAKLLFEDPIECQAAIIVVDHLGIEIEKVKLSSNFVDDLGADSLDLVELVMAFEEEFDIEEIPNEDAELITTFKEAVDYIRKRKAEKA